MSERQAIQAPGFQDGLLQRNTRDCGVEDGKQASKPTWNRPLSIRTFFLIFLLFFSRLLVVSLPVSALSLFDSLLAAGDFQTLPSLVASLPAPDLDPGYCFCYCLFSLVVESEKPRPRPSPSPFRPLFSAPTF